MVAASVSVRKEKRDVWQSHGGGLFGGEVTLPAEEYIRRYSLDGALSPRVMQCDACLRTTWSIGGVAEIALLVTEPCRGATPSNVGNCLSNLQQHAYSTGSL